MTSPTTPIALHYFRLPRHQWEWMLTRMRQLGADAIYTPLPWGFHEFSANKFDLTGLSNPRRNVAGFGKLCVKMGFRVIFDLLPGHEAGLLHGGFPGWLLHEHPETHALGPNGKSLPFITLAHPTTLKFGERWLQQLGQTLLDQQGPVSIQINLQNHPLNYNKHVAKVQWPVWLRKRYAEGGIAALNAAYAPNAPHRSFSKIALNAPLDAPAFRQDVEDFTIYLRDHAAKLYGDMLQKQGWDLAESILQPPPHGTQINPDPADAGASFQWAMDAPIRPDGTPKHTFWTLKKANLAGVLPDDTPIYVAELAGEVSFPVKANTLVGRLMLNGNLEQTIVETGNETAVLSAENKTGVTDLYFTLSESEAVLTGYLDGYLQSLLTGKTQTLFRCADMIAQLLTAFEKPSLSAESTSEQPITEAQTALTEANLALYKAATTIGALEGAFAVALDKSQTPEATPSFLALDAAQFEKVQTACQAVAPILKTASETPLNSPFTVEQYSAAHNSIIDAAAQVSAILEVVLQWLREELATQALPSTAWAVHAHLQTILQSLSFMLGRTGE